MLHLIAAQPPLTLRWRRYVASGKDATEDFEDVGHSDEARNMMAEKNDSGIKIVGTIEGEVPESMKSKASEDVCPALPAVGSTASSGTNLLCHGGSSPVPYCPHRAVLSFAVLQCPTLPRCGDRFARRATTVATQYS